MFAVLARLSLVTRILIAIILGFIVAYLFPNSAQYFIILGELFIKALKSRARGIDEKKNKMTNVVNQVTSG